MARIKKVPFPPWQTCKPTGIELRYIRLGNSQLLHERIIGLTHAAFRVYVYMLLESGGKRDFTFPKSKWKAFLSPGGFQGAVTQLCQAGLIEVTEKNANLRKPNKYRFLEDWKRKWH